MYEGVFSLPPGHRVLLVHSGSAALTAAASVVGSAQKSGSKGSAAATDFCRQRRSRCGRCWKTVFART